MRWGKVTETFQRNRSASNQVATMPGTMMLLSSATDSGSFLQWNRFSAE